MSVYYDVKEYLEVQKITEENSEILDFARSHLAWLGWKMLLDTANIRKISLCCGEKTFDFSGSTITTDLHNMIRALECASPFKLIMDYDYLWSESDHESTCDHLAISSYLDEVEEAGVKHIFYTMYNNADSGDGAGILSAYGERSGRVYKGIVQEKPISDFPDRGNWHAPREAIIYQPETLVGVDMAAVLDIVKQLKKLSEDDNLTNTEIEFSYCMNNFQARSAEDFKKFAYLAGRLIDLTNGECCICAELVDLDDPFGRILKIDIEDQENYTITMTAID